MPSSNETHTEIPAAPDLSLIQVCQRDIDFCGIILSTYSWLSFNEVEGGSDRALVISQAAPAA